MLLLKRHLQPTVAALVVLALVAAFTMTASISRDAVADGALLAGASQIEAGGDHTCALLEDGFVECWGLNASGQLGNDTFGPHQCLDIRVSVVFGCSTVPVDVCATGFSAPCPELLSGVASLATGSDHTCAVMAADGAVKCWGYNTNGQLGDDTITSRTTPVDVCETLPTPPATPPTPCSPLTGVIAVTAGQLHTCALIGEPPNSSVKCWGQNNEGQLGDGQVCAKEYCKTPVDVCSDATCQSILTGVAAVTAGPSGGHTCALMTADGSVKCWGRNYQTQLGDGDACGNICKTPVDVCASANCQSTLIGVAAVSAGGYHTCALMTSNDSVKCWGYNKFGQVGDGTNNWFPSTPVDVCETGASLPEPCDASNNLEGVSQVSAGGWHTCALKTDQSVVCWGWNEYGLLGVDSNGPDPGCPAHQEGTGGSTCSTRPVDVSGITGVAHVSAGALNSCALQGGGVECWGFNAMGQLGNGSADGPEYCDVSDLPPGSPCSPAPVNVVEALGVGDVGDSDNDGCSNDAENGADEMIGGQRNPKNPWDFYDVAGPGGPPDGFVDLFNDIVGVVQHYAPTGTEPGYDVNFDRGPSAGPNVWNLTKPDGKIDLFVDILGAMNQNFHDCR